VQAIGAETVSEEKKEAAEENEWIKAEWYFLFEYNTQEFS
jgi:hypothetical protein